jgi:hypothetical protein
VDPLARLAGLEGVASAMASARDGIDALLRDRGLRRTTPELTARSLLRGAQASDELEASMSDAGAVRVSTELLSLVPTLSRSPLQVLARLHTLAAKGSVPDDQLGRPAAGSSRLTDLSHLMLEHTSAPALVVAAVAHAKILTVAPFTSHNGIVARAFERLVIVARGVDPPSLTVPEAGHLSLRHEYESNLLAYRDGGPAGVHSWLLYAAAAYTAGTESSPLNTAR